MYNYVGKYREIVIFKILGMISLKWWKMQIMIIDIRRERERGYFVGYLECQWFNEMILLNDFQNSERERLVNRFCRKKFCNSDS